MATTDPKHIQFNRADKDYSAYYDGEYIGTFATYHQAEIELDAHTLDLLERGLIDTAEGITTMQWQGEPEPTLNALPEGHRRASDDEAGWWYRLGAGLQVWITDAPEPAVVYARPAEVAELIEVQAAHTCSDDDICLACRAEYDPPSPRCLNCGCRHICAPDGIIRCVACASRNIEYPNYDDLTGALVAPVDTTPPVAPPIPSASQDGATDATQPAASGLTNPRATLMALLKAALEEWKECGVATPYDVALAQLTRLMTPPAGHFLCCPLCGGPHTGWQCPEVALVKYGMDVWEAYLADRAAFLELAQWATAARLLLMGDAVALYLSHRWRHAITAQQVLAGWQTQNAAPTS